MFSVRIRSMFTEASTELAVKNFESWARNRSSSASEIVPPGILHSHDPELVCKWLCCFVLEARKLDGSRYPAATIRSLVSGLNRELQRHSAPFSVLDKGDYRFRALLKTLDSVSCELYKQCFKFIETIEHSVRSTYCTVRLAIITVTVLMEKNSTAAHFDVRRLHTLMFVVSDLYQNFENGYFPRHITDPFFYELPFDHICTLNLLEHHKLKVMIISLSTCIMLAHQGHPYVHSTTALCDILPRSKSFYM